MIQIACVKWGTRYDAESVNRIYRAAQRGTTTPIRFVLVTDDADAALDPGIVVKPFPPFALDFEDMKYGCKLKLSVFAPGILEPDLPTVYFDLDTVVRGDVSRMTDELARHPGLYMLQNYYVQFWRIRPLLNALGVRRYYFGNSSMLAFVPRRFHFIYEDFNRIMAANPPPWPKRYHSDERFISWSARDHVRVFPRRLAVKFAEEFMLPFVFLEDIRRRLPWIAARRRNLVAITFVGPNYKPAALAQIKKGEIMRYRHLRYGWEPDEFRDYWAI